MTDKQVAELLRSFGVYQAQQAEIIIKLHADVVGLYQFVLECAVASGANASHLAQRMEKIRQSLGAIASELPAPGPATGRDTKHPARSSGG